MKRLFLLFPCLLYLITNWAVSGEAEFFNDEADVIKAKLDNSSLGVPIFIRSHKSEDRLSADVYGKLNYPFSKIQQVFSSPANWCEIVTLSPNVKACTHQKKQKYNELDFYVGRKVYETPEDAYVLNYQYHLAENTADILNIVLVAKEGPMATRNYRIELQAIPAPNSTYLRIHTSYEPSFFSQLATSTYLTTLGRDKVGFSVVGSRKNGNPDYVKGVKGIIERNVMRYYLAMLAFMDTETLPNHDQFSLRNQRWFDLSEKFARQLHEMERAEYLKTKALERRNQYILQTKLNKNTNIRSKNIAY
jgi:hypothetical protein